MRTKNVLFTMLSSFHWHIPWSGAVTWWYLNGWRCLANSYLNAAVFWSVSPRLEIRMTADINVILQLLQRQIAPVPPAYSTVLPENHTPDPAILYGNSTPVLHSMYPIPNIQLDSRNTTIQVKIMSTQKDLFNYTECAFCSVLHILIFFFWILYLQRINFFYGLHDYYYVSNSLLT